MENMLYRPSGISVGRRSVYVCSYGCDVIECVTWSWPAAAPLAARPPCRRRGAAATLQGLRRASPACARIALRESSSNLIFLSAGAPPFLLARLQDPLLSIPGQRTIIT
jgi:hypothetical protein